jgi:hypothetical protein
LRGIAVAQVDVAPNVTRRLHSELQPPIGVGAGARRSARHTADVGYETERNLEFDLQALAGKARDDRAFAEELYCALCNADWVHDDGTEWRGSWRYAAEIVARLRGRGEDDLDFYCSPTGLEGTISGRVGAGMAALGWRGTGHGAPLRMIDFAPGERKVFVDGEWVEDE